MRAQNKAFKMTGALALCFVVSSLVGCDRISSMFGGSNKKDNNENSAPATSVPAPVSSVESAAPAELPQDVVARVGNWNITIDEFNDRLEKLKEILPEFDPKNANSKRLILEELVRQQLLVADAEQTGLAQRKDLVDTVEDFRKTLLVQELATSLTKDIQASEADALQYYEKNKKEFATKVEWKVREIVVPEENQANDILVLLLQGADFAETAKSRSKASTADKGGDLGFLSKLPFEQMQNIVASLEPGKNSGVFKGPDGFYIVKIDEKKGGEPRPFTSVKNELVKGLTLRKQQEAVLDYLNKLATKTKIQVNEGLLK